MVDRWCCSRRQPVYVLTRTPVSSLRLPQQPTHRDHRRGWQLSVRWELNTMVSLYTVLYCLYPSAESKPPAYVLWTMLVVTKVTDSKRINWSDRRPESHSESSFIKTCFPGTRWVSFVSSTWHYILHGDVQNSVWKENRYILIYCWLSWRPAGLQTRTHCLFWFFFLFFSFFVCSKHTKTTTSFALIFITKGRRRKKKIHTHY